MRYGLNMFGLNPTYLKDKELFLKRITKAGFKYLEPCVLFYDNPDFLEHAWTVNDLEANKALLEKYNVKIPSFFIFSKDLNGDLEEIIKVAGKYSVENVIMGCPPYTGIEEFKKKANEFKDVSDKLAKAGISLLIHNSGDVCKAKIGDVSAYEWFINNAGESTKAEPDLGWLLYGGVDPEAFLWRNRSKIALLHYKDMKSENGSFSEAEIGRGDVDDKAAFQFARAVEIIQFMDQDSFDGEPLDVVDRIGERFNDWKNARENSDSILCVMDTETGKVTELKTFENRIVEAPNWYQQDDDYLYYNSDGCIYRYCISTGEESKIESGHCTNCNNDHVISADGKYIAVSHSETSWMSQVYILPIEGGEPRLITENAPSFLHGWSPDRKELAYCAFRGDWENIQVDIFAISENGGEEWQLTGNAGFNDGPEYSPDGNEILFISTRTGLMQNWKMNRDGSGQTQLTFSEKNNWFGHYSPDGRKIVYLSYSRDGLDPNEHLPNMDVELSLMNADGSDDHVILKFFGGQGSINVNSWNPDSKRFAFVKYRLNHK